MPNTPTDALAEIEARHADIEAHMSARFAMQRIVNTAHDAHRDRAYLLSRLRSVPPVVTEEMVERATAELLAHAICTEGSDIENKRLMRIAAQSALKAALSPATGTQPPKHENPMQGGVCGCQQCSPQPISSPLNPGVTEAEVEAATGYTDDPIVQVHNMLKFVDPEQKIIPSHMQMCHIRALIAALTRATGTQPDIRAATIEECAKLCDKLRDGYVVASINWSAFDFAAKCIRALSSIKPGVE